MCGRFVVADPGSELVRILRVDTENPDLPPPSYNIAPTDRAAIVLDSAKTDPPTRRLEPARWGLVPSWAKDPKEGVRAINARAETADTTTLFRSALQKRRSIVPASGYYEWQRAGDAKVPHYIHPADGAPLFFAGLYEWWRDPRRADDDPERWVLSFTILTRGAVGALEKIHDRMPLFLDPDFADAWLDTDTDDDNVRDLLDAAIDAAPHLAETLRADEVSPSVGNVRNNAPDLIAPVGAAPGDQP